MGLLKFENAVSFYSNDCQTHVIMQPDNMPRNAARLLSVHIAKVVRNIFLMQKRNMQRAY